MVVCITDNTPQGSYIGGGLIYEGVVEILKVKTHHLAPNSRPCVLLHRSSISSRSCRWNVFLDLDKYSKIGFYKKTIPRQTENPKKPKKKKKIRKLTNFFLGKLFLGPWGPRSFYGWGHLLWQPQLSHGWCIPPKSEGPQKFEHSFKDKYKLGSKLLF